MQSRMLGIFIKLLNLLFYISAFSIYPDTINAAPKKTPQSFSRLRRLFEAFIYNQCKQFQVPIFENKRQHSI